MSFPDGTRFYPDVKDGVRGYNTDPARGADTFSPFKSVDVRTASVSFSAGEGVLADARIRPESKIYINTLSKHGVWFVSSKDGLANLYASSGSSWFSGTTNIEYIIL